MYGFDTDEMAIEDARYNAQANGVTNAEFMKGNIEETFPSALSGSEDLKVKVVIHPPRPGFRHFREYKLVQDNYSTGMIVVCRRCWVFCVSVCSCAVRDELEGKFSVLLQYFIYQSDFLDYVVELSANQLHHVAL